MKGHPLHGTNPLAKKLTLRAQGATSGTEVWKVLSRAPGEIAWECEKRISEQEARIVGSVRTLEGKEVRISRL
jgi:hypothetical protein